MRLHYDLKKDVNIVVFAVCVAICKDVHQGKQ